MDGLKKRQKMLNFLRLKYGPGKSLDEVDPKTIDFRGILKKNIQEIPKRIPDNFQNMIRTNMRKHHEAYQRSLINTDSKRKNVIAFMAKWDDFRARKDEAINAYANIRKVSESCKQMVTICFASQVLQKAWSIFGQVMKERKAKQKMIFMLKIGLINYRARARRIGTDTDTMIWKTKIRNCILFPTLLHVDVAEHKAKHKVLTPFFLEFLSKDVFKQTILKTYN